MEITTEINNAILTFVATYKMQLILSVAVLILLWVIVKLIIPRIEVNIEQSNLKNDALVKAKQSLHFIVITLSFALVTFVWGFDYRGLMTVSASVLAVLGVSLFAGWSIISNITAFFLLVFHKSYRRGNFLRIVHADNYIEGYISEINLFRTTLITEEREFIIYPNNLLFSSPAIINPRDRNNSIGKIGDLKIH